MNSLWKGDNHDQKENPQSRQDQADSRRFQLHSPSFSHRRFLALLDQKEILLYLFLILVSDRHGLSYYSYDMICSLIQLTLDEYIEARDGLLKKDLISFDGKIFQVLDLPAAPHPSSPMSYEDPAVVARMIRQSLAEASR
jgi:hypothetical protein